VRTKICGITSYEDAMIAIESGANAVGFVFYENSPRYITQEKAKEIISKLPPFVEKVALFVNTDANFINNTCKNIGATLAQIHFEAEDELYEQLSVPYIKVVRAKEVKDVSKYSDEYRLVDAYCETYGGSGKKINLEWFKDVDCSKIILAGGLDSKNVLSLKEYGFYAVDVSSGVEMSKGVKSQDKVKQFIKNTNL
jgi:phosphoribosylanthranilate isomerase